MGMSQSSHFGTRGFSLVELSVSIGVSALLALGTAASMVQTVRATQQQKVRAEAFGLTRELRSWMSTIRKIISEIQDDLFKVEHFIKKTLPKEFPKSVSGTILNGLLARAKKL